MNAAIVTLWTAAVLIFAYAPVYLLVVSIRERRRDREDHITPALAVANVPQVDPRAERFHNYGVTR